MKITKQQLRKLVREQAERYVAKSPMDSSPVTYEDDNRYYIIAVNEWARNDQDHKIIDAFGGKDEYIQRVANSAEHQALAGGYGGISRGSHEWTLLGMVRARV